MPDPTTEEALEKLGAVRQKVVDEMEVVNASRRALALLLQEVDLLENRLTKEMGRLCDDNARLRAENAKLTEELERARRGA